MQLNLWAASETFMNAKQSRENAMRVTKTKCNLIKCLRIVQNIPNYVREVSENVCEHVEKRSR